MLCFLFPYLCWSRLVHTYAAHGWINRCCYPCPSARTKHPQSPRESTKVEIDTGVRIYATTRVLGSQFLVLTADPKMCRNILNVVGKAKFASNRNAHLLYMVPFFVRFSVFICFLVFRDTAFLFVAAWFL